MANYATYADVSAELGAVSITAATTITSAMVDGWISDAELDVELLTGQVYTSTSITSSAYEYHSYDGTRVVKLDKYPVISITSLEYEENGHSSTTESWVSLFEGRGSDKNFLLFKDVGAIKLHPNTTSNWPTVGDKNLRVAYVYGHTSVPRNIKEYVVKVAAKRYILAVANKNASKSSKSMGVGAININDPNNYVFNHLGRLNAEIEALTERLGKLRVVNYDLRLYD
jgi:hypothetical protein